MSIYWTVVCIFMYVCTVPLPFITSSKFIHRFWCQVNGEANIADSKLHIHVIRFVFPSLCTETINTFLRIEKEALWMIHKEKETFYTKCTSWVSIHFAYFGLKTIFDHIVVIVRNSMCWLLVLYTYHDNY